MSCYFKHLEKQQHVYAKVKTVCSMWKPVSTRPKQISASEKCRLQLHATQTRIEAQHARGVTGTHRAKIQLVSPFP